MKTKAAVAWKINEPWSVEEFELADPGPGEVLVKLAFAGLCHSDEHIRLGDLTEAAVPMIGGHEGAGVVEAVGEGVTRVAVGDHVSASFIPACGVCPMCSTGQQNLCDRGAETMIAPARHTSAEHGEARAMAGLGTFSQYMVADQDSVIKVENWYPLEAVALVSCGVCTGWGSAVNVAQVEAGDTVVIVGIGGIGMNAVQGAAMAGAANVIAIDPVESKREHATTFGATHTASSMTEAQQMVNDLTWGRMANSVILTMGEATSEVFAEGMALVGKGGDLTLTSLSKIEQNEITINTFDMTMNQKQLRGNVFGGCNPRADIPRLLRLYDQGKLKLDELITKRYSLDQINEGYAAMHAGDNLRGVIDMSL